MTQMTYEGMVEMLMRAPADVIRQAIAELTLALPNQPGMTRKPTAAESATMTLRMATYGDKKDAIAAIIESMTADQASPFSLYKVGSAFNQNLRERIGQLEEARDKLIIERDDADRRAGAAERLREADADSLIRMRHARDRQKAEAGYDHTVSFDKVWEETIAKAKAYDEQGGARANGVDLLAMANHCLPEDVESLLKFLKAKAEGTSKDKVRARYLWAVEVIESMIGGLSGPKLMSMLLRVNDPILKPLLEAEARLGGVYVTSFRTLLQSYADGNVTRVENGSGASITYGSGGRK